MKFEHSTKSSLLRLLFLLLDIVKEKQKNVCLAIFVFSFFVFSFLLAVSLCASKKRNDLLGLEGMVKIKNPDDNLHNSTSALKTDTVDSVADNDVKRWLISFTYIYLLYIFHSVNANASNCS